MSLSGRGSPEEVRGCWKEGLKALGKVGPRGRSGHCSPGGDDFKPQGRWGEGARKSETEDTEDELLGNTCMRTVL